MSLGWRAESWRAGIRFRWIADRPGPPPQRYFRAITGSTGQLRKSCVSSALHRVHPVCLHLSASLCLSRRALLAFYNRRCPSSNERDVSVSTSTVLPSLQSNTIPCTCVCELLLRDAAALAFVAFPHSGSVSWLAAPQSPRCRSRRANGGPLFSNCGGHPAFREPEPTALLRTSAAALLQPTHCIAELEQLPSSLEAVISGRLAGLPSPTSSGLVASSHPYHSRTSGSFCHNSTTNSLRSRTIKGPAN